VTDKKLPAGRWRLIMAEKIVNKLTKQLCEALFSLKSEQEVANFLEDVCTISEFRALAQRYEVARLLDGGVKYEEIVELTGASTATISRVKRCLVYGKDGYAAALANMKEKKAVKEQTRPAKKAQPARAKAERKRAVRKNNG